MSSSAFDSTGCPTCEGDGYLGDPEYGAARNCSRCNGRGTLKLWELTEDELDELDGGDEQEDEA